MKEDESLSPKLHKCRVEETHATETYSAPRSFRPRNAIFLYLLEWYLSIRSSVHGFIDLLPVIPKFYTEIPGMVSCEFLFK